MWTDREQVCLGHNLSTNEKWTRIFLTLKPLAWREQGDLKPHVPCGRGDWRQSASGLPLVTRNPVSSPSAVNPETRSINGVRGDHAHASSNRILYTSSTSDKWPSNCPRHVQARKCCSMSRSSAVHRARRSSQSRMINRYTALK